MGRKTKDPQEQIKRQVEEIRERAEDMRDRAQRLADTGGDAVKGFADSTRSAAKRFAQTTMDATKELLESVEAAGQAGEDDEQPRRRGRKLLKASIALGAGAALFANEKVRGAITGMFGGNGSSDEWTTGSNETSEPTSTTTP